MQRDDISDDLVHFTKGATIDIAFETLKKILAESFLIGGSGHIKGGYKCVCFSEAPIHHLSRALIGPKEIKPRYSPFGIIVSKKWLFERGGLPVIYQSDCDFEKLPEEIRWRHVRYEPTINPPIDFTWEREWRIFTRQLDFSPTDVRVILPSQGHVEMLRECHDKEEFDNAWGWEAVLGSLCWQYMKPFPWTITSMEEIVYGK